MPSKSLKFDTAMLDIESSEDIMDIDELSKESQADEDSDESDGSTKKPKKKKVLFCRKKKTKLFLFFVETLIFPKNAKILGFLQ